MLSKNAQTRHMKDGTAKGRGRCVGELDATRLKVNAHWNPTKKACMTHNFHCPSGILRNESLLNEEFLRT